MSCDYVLIRAMIASSVSFEYTWNLPPTGTTAICNDKKSKHDYSFNSVDLTLHQAKPLNVAWRLTTQKDWKVSLVRQPLREEQTSLPKILYRPPSACILFRGSAVVQLAVEWTEEREIPQHLLSSVSPPWLAWGWQSASPLPQPLSFLYGRPPVANSEHLHYQNQWPWRHTSCRCQMDPNATCELWLIKRHP